MCQTINNSWGYRLRDTNHKSTKDLIHLLVRASGYNSNLLLNVGPMPTGQIDPISTARLREMGQWLAKNGETIYGTRGGFLTPSYWGAITQKGNKIYLHILNKDGANLTLDFPNAIESARWFNVDHDLVWNQNAETNVVTFSLDGATDPINSIIEVVVK